MLLEPGDGLPPVASSAEDVARAADQLARGDGPIALDAERASGFRYGQRAYLIQLRRRGSGTVLVDPAELDSRRLAPLGEAVASAEWVLHAASQDLPCLRELGLRPTQLFDTELAGRLLGYPRVGLAAMTQEVLGVGLKKGHGAADWSRRPLPEDWLRYAALDVEVLVELRDALAEQLVAAGKLPWAEQEFAALVTAGPPTARPEPWRRTSGMHRVRRPRQLAIVKELWQARDAQARQRDLAPGRVLPDAAIVEAALAQPAGRGDLAALPTFSTKGARRHLDQWWTAIRAASTVPDDDLPPLQAPTIGPPPARSWPERNPAAAARLAALRSAVAALADEHTVPTENLLAPDTVRRLAWEPPAATDTAVREVLLTRQARPWQVELTLRPLVKALDRLERDGSRLGAPRD